MLIRELTVKEEMTKKFDKFVLTLKTTSFENFILSKITGNKADEFKNYLIIAIDEARYALSELQVHLSRNLKILEVGSGMGILTSFLAKEGYDITGIEPGGVGFENNISYPELIREFTKVNFNFYPISIEALNKNPIGKFDLIFSVNVMEHVAYPEKCLTILHNNLLQNGKMIHVCPNYFVPYEPHYNFFLIPFAPHQTHYIIAKKIKTENLWRSLNFITYFKVKKYAGKCGAVLKFKRGTIHEAFSRLGSDAEFTKRHRGFVLFTFKMMKFTGLLGLLKFLPPGLATPMIFEWQKK